MKKTTKYILGFIGLLLIFVYIWSRFLRVRVEKNIPLDLKIYSMIIILIICSLYIYNLYFLITMKEKKPLINFHQYLVKLVYPLVVLDDIIKEIKKIRSTMTKIFVTFIIKYKCYKSKNNLYFYLLFNFIPKGILLITLILDIFIYKKIANFYDVIILGLLVLFYNYFLYSIKKDFDSIKHFLDLNCYIKITSINDDSKNYFVDPCLLISKDDGFFDTYYFLNTQAISLIWENDLYDFVFVETYDAREEYANKKNIKDTPIHIMVANFDDISKELSKHFYIEAEKAIYYLAFLKIKEEFIQKYIRKLNIVILTGYLICWIYVLIISFHTLENLKILLLIKDLMEPFSGIRL